MIRGRNTFLLFHLTPHIPIFLFLDLFLTVDKIIPFREGYFVVFGNDGGERCHG